LITRVLEGRLGLDSTPYTNKKPLIVTHGHQWDFWNCDPNNLAGKLIANSIAVPLDGLDDPFVDLGGIALNGSPMIDFANGLATLPVLSNFPSYLPARAFANAMQQRTDKTRLLIDDEMYLESLPALISLFAMPLSITDERGEVSWSDEPKTLGNIGKVFEHLFNMICVGHTHYPQSQPYFNVEKLFLGPLADVLNLIREAVADSLFGFTPSLNVKTRYFNSGTVGWMEGVIWAIEISGAGQARLVYWTRDTRPDRPQTMDWELPVMNPAQRQALDAKRDELIAYLERQFDLFRTSQDELGALLSGGGVSFDTLLVFAGDADFTLALVEPERAGAPLDDVLGQVRAQVGQVALVLLQVFAAMLRAQVSGQPGPGRRFTISAPLPGDIEAQLERITAALDGLPNIPSERLPQLACAWLFGSCGSQFIGGTVNKFNPAPSGPRQDYPVLWSLLALVPLLPSINENALFSATVSFANGSLNVEITVS
jgi:hypothetical protein